jgi:hypothetical protein
VLAITRVPILNDYFFYYRFCYTGWSYLDRRDLTELILTVLIHKLLLVFFCIRTPPSHIFEASQYTTKYSFGSDKINTGADVNRFLSSSKLFSQWNLLPSTRTHILTTWHTTFFVRSSTQSVNVVHVLPRTSSIPEYHLWKPPQNDLDMNGKSYSCIPWILWCIGHIKRHHCILVMIVSGPEIGLWYIIFLYSDLVISWPHINLAKHSSSH